MIITPALVMQALRQTLETVFPGEVVYENLTPVDFERPSNMVEITGLTLDAMGLGHGAVGLQFQAKIITFCEVDEVHDSHLPTLDLRAMTILSALAAGYLKVGDRAPKITACTADTSLYDSAEVKLTLSVNIDRSEFCPAELLPMMEELHTKFNAKENVT